MVWSDKRYPCFAFERGTGASQYKYIFWYMMMNIDPPDYNQLNTWHYIVNYLLAIILTCTLHFCRQQRLNSVLQRGSCTGWKHWQWLYRSNPLQTQEKPLLLSDRFTFLLKHGAAVLAWAGSTLGPRRP